MADVTRRELLSDITAPRAWTAVACLAFLFATAYAIAVVFFRLPIPGIEGPYHFRVALALHVELAVYFWLMASLAAQWSAASPLRDKEGMPRTDLLLPGLAGAGTLLVAASPLAGGTPRMADYFPWLLGNQWFLVGFAAFSAAVLLAAVSALARTLARHEAGPWRGIGIQALPVIAAAATVVTCWIGGARDLEQFAWAAGHTLLFAHVGTMCWEWFRMGQGSRPGGEKLRRAVLWALAGSAALLPLIPLIHPPGSPAFGAVYTASMTWLLWPPALLAGLYVLHRLFSGEESPLAASVVPRALIAVAFAFFVIGNLLGAMIDGGTTLVTAHYHAAIGAVALTRMASTYFAGDRLAIGVPSRSAVRRQLAAYAVALLLLFGGLTVGAVDEAPRKTSAGELVEKGPYFKLGMSISGVGGLFAIAGSLWLVVNLMRPGSPSRGGHHPRVDSARGRTES